MTLTPQPGQQVRVVKSKTDGLIDRRGQIGTVARAYPDVTYVQMPDGSQVAALEVAPIWQVGDRITSEKTLAQLPIGAEVGAGSHR